MHERGHVPRTVGGPGWNAELADIGPPRWARLVPWARLGRPGRRGTQDLRVPRGRRARPGPKGPVGPIGAQGSPGPAGPRGFWFLPGSRALRGRRVLPGSVALKSWRPGSRLPGATPQARNRRSPSARAGSEWSARPSRSRVTAGRILPARRRWTRSCPAAIGRPGRSPPRHPPGHRESGRLRLSLFCATAGLKALCFPSAGRSIVNDC